MSNEESKNDVVKTVRELLSKVTPGPWFDFESGEWLHEPKSLLSHFDDAVLIARAPELLSSLCDAVEQLKRDKTFLGERLEAQAETMSRVVAERNQLRESSRVMKEAIEAALEFTRMIRQTADHPNVERRADKLIDQLRSAITPKGSEQ